MEILHLAINMFHQFLRIHVSHVSRNNMLPEVVAIYTAYLLVIFHSHYRVDDTLQTFLYQSTTTKVSASLHQRIRMLLQLLLHDRRFHLSHSMKSDIALARIETLRRRNNITLIIIGNKVVQLSVVLGILVFILLAIIKAKLVCVITIPPQLICRHFILDDTIFAFQTVCSVHFGIFLRRSNPVTITQLTFLHRSRNSTINLYLNILLTILNGINSRIDGFHRFQSMRSVLRITLRVREVIIRLRSIAQSHILQVHIRTARFPIITSRLVAFISRVSRCFPCTYTLI